MVSIHTTRELGKVLGAARKRLGLTQSQLALAAGVATGFVAEMEAGRPTLRFENVVCVVEALGGKVTLSGLPTGSEGGSKGA